MCVSAQRDEVVQQYFFYSRNVYISSCIHNEKWLKVTLIKPSQEFKLMLILFQEQSRNNTSSQKKKEAVCLVAGNILQSLFQLVLTSDHCQAATRINSA